MSLALTLPVARAGGAPLLAWGKNWYGQTNIPAAATNLLAVGAGWQHGLALRADGMLVPWGYDGYSLAVMPPEATNNVAIAVGDYHNLALRADGKVFAWGKNEAGESTVPADATNIVALDGGYSHTLALRADGTVMVWGDNTFGQLNIPPAATNVVAIAAGMDHNVVLKADGSVVVWGYNQSGETNLPPSATNVMAISAAASHSLALRADGTIVPWGSTVFGETTVPTNIFNVKAISSGGWFNLVVLQNGSASGWGYDYNKQATPPLAVTNPAALYAGGEFSVAWLRDPSTGIAPTIWKQPPDRAFVGGRPLYLHPGVNGTPPLQYQWHFNNTPMPGQTNRWLSLPNSNPTQSGNYRLVVSNDFGAATSQVAAVTIEAIQFIVQPADVTIMMNKDVTLAATVTGTAPLTYRWLKDGQPLSDTTRLSGSDTSSLTNQWVLGADSGDYKLVVSNAYAVATSEVAQVTVRMPAPLLNVDFNGGLASAKTGFAGMGQTDADFWNGHPGGSSSVSNLFLADGSQSVISITITNSLFSRWIEYTDPMLHNFVYPPHLAGPFTVQISGLPAGTYSFYLYNAGTKYWPWYGSDFELLVGGVSLGRNVLTGWIEDPPPWREGIDYGTFHNVRVANSQQSVALVVRGNIGQDPTIAGLQIGGILTSNAPPVLWSQPASRFVPLGTDIVLTATGSGFPAPAQQWFFNSVPLANNLRITGAQSNRLVITGAEFLDAGNYYAVLTNASGVITSTTAAIVVGIPAGLSTPLSNQTWIAGSTSSLVAAGTGTEPLTYRWSFGATTLTNNSRISGAATNILSLSNVMTSDAGTYTLVVTNPFGSVTSTATVVVVVPPAFTRHPAGASVPVGMPLTLSAALSGTAPLNYQWRFNGTNVPGATTNSLNFAALTPNDFGDYQLVVSNYGEVITSVTAQVTIGSVAIWGSYSVSTIPIWPGPGLSNVIAVAGGSGFSLALRADGTVYGWGSGTSTNVPAGLNNVVSISAGSQAMAVRADGTVAAWGVGASGQTTIPPGLSNVIMVAAGDTHSAALRRDGTVVVWGGSTAQKQTNLPAGLMQVVAIRAGGSQTLALRENGDVVGWGGSTPFPVPPYLHGVAQVSAPAPLLASSGFALALLTNGTVTAWGSSGWPTNMFPGISNVMAVEAAGGARGQDIGVINNASMILQSNGLVSGWAMGTSPLINVPPGVSNAVAISGGYTHMLALLNADKPLILRPPAGGTFYTGDKLRLKAAAEGRPPLSFQWHKDGIPMLNATNDTFSILDLSGADAGSYHLVVTNEFGAAQSIAVPVTIVDSPPVLMSQPASRYAWYGSPVAFGASVIGSGPMLLTWFQDGSPVASDTKELLFERALPQHGGAYQLVASNLFGSATSSVAQITFSKVATWGGAPGLSNAPVDLGSVLAVASGYNHALAIRSNRTVAAWGTTANGVTNVPVGLSNVVAISGGNNFSVALKSDGTVAAWGLGTSGQTNVPAGLSNVVAISAGGSHALALRANGTVVAWGPTLYGVTNVPAGLSNVVAIAAGSVHSLALKDDGTVVRWGNNGTPPVLTDIVAISAGYNQSLALQANGTVLGWTTAKAPGPQVGLTNVVAISAGGGYSGYSLNAALRADGTLIAWGDNNSLGQTSVPADLLSATTISAGGSSTLALLNDHSPAIALQPWSRRVASGTNVTLGVLTVGQAPVQYQWYCNDEPVVGGTNNWLAFTNTHPSHTGAYQLVAMNDYGTVTSAVARLTVTVPNVTLTPLNLTGSGFRFSFISLVGALYIVEFKDDLAATTWIELERRFGIGGLEIVTAPSVGGVSRFYRVRAVYAPSPKVGSLSWNGSAAMFSFATVPGAVYVVQFKERLDDPSWQELSRQTGTGAPIVVSDPNPPAPSRFYRVRVE